MKIKFTTDAEAFVNDYMDVVRAFSPHVIDCSDGETLSLSVRAIREDYYCFILRFGEIEIRYYKNPFKIEQFITQDVKKRALIKRASKACLYDFISRLTGKALPYGSLTGIRPTKLFHELTARGIDARSCFLRDLRVGKDKTDLIAAICDNQRPIYDTGEKEIDLFVNIPICVTRCVYCSFISAQLDKVAKFVPDYCRLLCDELDDARRLIEELGWKVRAVYVGGGTPTSLDADRLYEILNRCRFDSAEFTVEAGRPDTITRDKLDAMARCGVTRISVNPQTFSQRTLDAIGRKHSVEEIYRVYAMAREYPFDINMDLIAMLPGEDLQTFAHSVDCAIALDPENVTVHTLALKRGSVLKVDGYDNFVPELPARMIDYSIAALTKAGYVPYYLYKQKYMSGNLENVGYCKVGKTCLYNVDIMEETTSILANGAGGISKYVDRKIDVIHRHANPKGLDVYLQRGEENLTRKRDFFHAMTSGFLLKD